MVAVRERPQAEAPELRLIVGPLPNAEAATRLCATLSAARRYCQPTTFEGQRLSQAVAPSASPSDARSATRKPPRRQQRNVLRPHPGPSAAELLAGPRRAAA